MARITPQGVETRSISEIIQSLQSRFRDRIGESVALDDETPFGQIIGIEALEIVQAEEAIVAAGNAMSVSNSQGVQLDDLMTLHFTPRRGSDKSTVTASVAGVAGTILPVGARARTPAGDQFETKAQVILDLGAPKDVEMQSVDDGPIPAAVGSLSSIVTLVPGWETITNTVAAVSGQVQEPDDSVKAKHRNRTARNSITYVDSLIAGIYETDGILIGRILENYTDEFDTIQGFSLFPHSILAIIRSDAMSDNDAHNQALGQAIFHNKGQGTGLSTIIRGITPASVADILAASTKVITWNGTTRDLIVFAGVIAKNNTVVIPDMADIGDGYPNDGVVDVEVEGAMGSENAIARVTIDGGVITGFIITRSGYGYLADATTTVSVDVDGGVPTTAGTILTSPAAPGTHEEIAGVIQATWRRSGSIDINRNSIYYRFPIAGGQYNVIYPWKHSFDPSFGNDPLTTTLGLDNTSRNRGITPHVPFIKPTKRTLTVAATVLISSDFLSNGQTQIIQNLIAITEGYDIGVIPWPNDYLVAIERIQGARVSGAMVVEDGTNPSDSEPISNVVMPLDAYYVLDRSGIDLTIVTV